MGYFILGIFTGMILEGVFMAIMIPTWVRGIFKKL